MDADEQPTGARVRFVRELELQDLPRGRKSKLMVELVHDGLGRAMSVPVVVVRGEKPGPTFGITAALHGNELNGIPVLHRLFERIDPRVLRGTLVGVMVANVPGFHLHQREFNDGADLNHLMPGVPNGNVSEVYASRLIQRIVSKFDRMIDLHTASFGRVNSLYIRADLSNDIAAEMAFLVRPQIVLHNPASDLTLRGHAMELGIPAITVEIGNPQRFQPEYIRSTLIGVRRVLSAAGMLPRRKHAPGLPPLVCQRSHWIYTDHGGLLEVLPKLTQVLDEGEVVARLTDAFGDVTREYRAPEGGVVIGASTNPVAQTGARILHLGLIGEPGVAVPPVSGPETV